MLYHLLNCSREVIITRTLVRVKLRNHNRTSQKRKPCDQFSGGKEGGGVTPYNLT